MLKKLGISAAVLCVVLSPLHAATPDEVESALEAKYQVTKRTLTGKIRTPGTVFYIRQPGMFAEPPKAIVPETTIKNGAIDRLPDSARDSGNVPLRVGEPMHIYSIRTKRDEVRFQLGTVSTYDRMVLGQPTPTHFQMAIVFAYESGLGSVGIEGILADIGRFAVTTEEAAEIPEMQAAIERLKVERESATEPKLLEADETEQQLAKAGGDEIPANGPQVSAPGPTRGSVEQSRESQRAPSVAQPTMRRTQSQATANGRSFILNHIAGVKTSYPRAEALEGCPVSYGPLKGSDVTALLYGSSLTFRRSPGTKRTSDVLFNTPQMTPLRHEATDVCVGAGSTCALVYVCEGGEADVALVSTGYSGLGPSLIYNLEKRPIPAMVSEIRRGRLFEGEQKALQLESSACRVFIPADSLANRATWSGGCVNGMPVGTGRLSLFDGVELVDYLDVDPLHHLEFEGGELFWKIDLREYAFAMDNCSVGSNGRPYTTITSITPRPSSAMANFTVAQKLLEAGIEFGGAVCGHNPPVLDGARSGVQFTGHQAASVYARADELGAISTDKISSYAINDKRAEVRRLNAERIHNERQIVQERIRVAVTDAKLARETKAKKAWERKLNSSDPWDNIADLLKHYPARTMSLLSGGHQISMEVRTVEFSNGRVIVQGAHPYTNIYAGVEQEAMESLGLAPEEMDGFTWEKWFDMVQQSTQDRYVTILCQLDPQKAGNVTVDSKYIFRAKLLDYSDPEYGAPRVRMDCGLVGAAR